MPWVTENARFVIFTASQRNETAQTIWQSRISTQMESFNTIGPGWTSATGKEKDCFIDVQVQPSRIDVIITPADNQPSPLATPGSFADPASAFSLGCSLIANLGAGHNSARAAFVVQRFCEAKDTAEINAILKDRVAILTLDEDSLDVSFQVNKRINSNVIKKVQINRLCRWFSATKIAFIIQNSAPVQQSGTQAVIEVIDLNTVLGAPLSASRLPSLFDELVRMYKDIEAGGYNAL